MATNDIIHGNRLMLDKIEDRKYQEFMSKHCGVIELIISFCEIGSTVELHCKGCDMRIDITNYDCW